MGQGASFHCPSNRDVSWEFQNSSQVKPRNVEIGGKFHSIMTIFNLKMHDTGIYKCITKDGIGKKHILVGILYVYGKYYSSCTSKLELWLFIKST